MRVGAANPKSVWWNDEVKTMVYRKEDAWNEVLGGRDEGAREKCLEVYKEEKIKGAFIKVRRRFKNRLEGR